MQPFRFDLQQFGDEPNNAGDPIKLTPEQLDAAKKELGLDDHASKVISRTQNEAKTHREKAEAEATRAAAAEAKAAAAEAKATELETARKKLETEKAEREGNLETALKNVREETDRKLTEAQTKAAEERTKERAETNAAVVRTEVKAALREAGIIDPALVDLFDRKDLKLEDGEIVGLEEFVAKAKEAKPNFFGDAKTEQTRATDGRFTRPDPTKPKGGKDWSKGGTDAEFQAEEARLRASRA